MTTTKLPLSDKLTFLISTELNVCSIAWPSLEGGPVQLVCRCVRSVALPI